MIKNKEKKEDLFNSKKTFNHLYNQLEQEKLYTHKKNNKVIKIYIDAKIKGYYSRLRYNINKPEITCLSNIQKLIYLERYFNKPLTELTQKDIDELQRDLDTNNIYTQNKLNQPIKQPISYGYKKDLIKHLKTFWKFYQLYAKEEENKTIPNITEYIRVKQEEQKEIEYIDYKEFLEILKVTKNIRQKTFLSIAFETSARPIEILKLKRKHIKYDEEEKAYLIKLPKEKGTSSNKHTIIIDSFNDTINKYLTQNHFQPEDYIFSYTYNYYRNLIADLGQKAIGKRITPKILRKSNTMYMINQGLTEQYIKAHNGWSSNSKVLEHYISQKGIKKPEHIRSKIRKETHQDYETQLTLLKSEMNKMQNQMKKLSTLKEDLQKDIQTIKYNDFNPKDPKIQKQIKNLITLLANSK